MKDNAPWTDDTTDARQGLNVTVERAERAIGDLRIAHREDLAYPIYLERDYQGRFEIIRPTLDHWGPRFARSLQNIANLKLITIVE